MKILKELIILLMLVCLVGCNQNNGTKTKKGEEFTIYNGYEFPSALGGPELSQEEIASLDDETAFLKINTYGDYMMYVKDKNYTDSKEMVEDTYTLLYGDYEELGRVYINGDEHYYLMYLKTNGKYYPIDIFNIQEKWLSNYPVTKYSYDDLNELTRDLVIKGTKGIFTYSYCDEYYKLGDSPYTFINGERYKLTNKCGITLYEFQGNQIPVDFGEPQYTNEEIYEMIDSKDYASIASKLNTYADVVNYVRRAQFVADKNEKTNFYQNIDYGDFGNIHYSDEDAIYTASGLEILMFGKAQCSASCALFKYLLEGDYPEIGYITLTNTHGGHAMLYIKTDSGKYYLVNPAEIMFNNNDELDKLVTREDTTDTIAKRIYLGEYDEKACCDSLQELIDGIVKSSTYGGTDLKRVTTICYDGVIYFATKKLGDNSADIMFPEGSNSHIWYGDQKEDLYVKPKHSTDQEHVIGLPKY